MDPDERVSGSHDEPFALVKALTNVTKAKNRFDANLAHFEKGDQYVLGSFLEKCGEKFVLNSAESENKYYIHLESFVLTPKAVVLESRARRQQTSRVVLSLSDEMEKMIRESL